MSVTNVILCIVLVSFFCRAEAQETEEYLTNLTLNVRGGPGVNYPVIGQFPVGTTVVLKAKHENGWWEVKTDDTEGFVASSFLTFSHYTGWEKVENVSGKASECDNIGAQFDYDLDNYLRIVVGGGTDVVVKLMQIRNGDEHCIRVAYISGGDTHEMRNIPEGRYYLKLAYGLDYRKRIVDGDCIMKFMRNALYEKGMEVLDFNLTRGPDKQEGKVVYETWSVPSYELALGVHNFRTEDTFPSRTISEHDFND